MIATNKNKLLGYLLIEIVDGEFIGASLYKTLTEALKTGTTIGMENSHSDGSDIEADLQFNGRFCSSSSIQRGWNLYLSPLYEMAKQ